MNNPILHLSICCVLLLCRLLLPYSIYLFVPYTLIFSSVYFIKNISSFIKFDFFYFIKTNLIFILLSVGFIIGLLLSSKMPFYLLKEVFAMIMLFVLMFLFYIIINSKEKFNTFFHFFKIFLYITVFITSILAILKFNLEFSGVYFDFLRTNYDKYYPVGSTLIIDYNFFSLINIICFVFIVFDLLRANLSKRKIIYLQLLLFFIYNNVFFSSSRRGWILLMLVNVAFLLVSVYNIFFKKLKFKIPYLYFGLIFSFTSLFFLFFRTSHQFQDKILTTLNYDKEYFNFEINRISNRYLTIFFPNKTIQLTNPYLNGESTGTVKESTSVPSTSISQNTDVKKEDKINIKTVLSDTNNLSGNRMIRIKYAFHIFKESSLFSQIFGSGFDYMILFGHHFFTKNHLPFHYDYPHNPFLSSLLYGGVTGLLITLIFSIYNLLISIRLIRLLPEYFVIYIFFIYFIFFSFNSLFGIPEFLFFTIILTRFYFIHNKKSNVQEITI